MANASHLSSVNVLRQHINNLINNQFFSAIKFTNWATFSNLLKKPEIRSYFNLSDNLVNKLHNVVYDHNQMDFPIDFSEEEINILKIFYIFTEATSLFTEASKALAEHEPNEKYMNSYTPLGQSNLKGLLAHHRSRKSLADEVITLLEKKNAGYLDAALKLITTTKDHRKKYISSVRDFSGPLNLVYTFSNLVKNEIEIQPTKELLKAFAENDGYEVHYYYNLPIAKDLIKTYSYFLERNLTRICSLKSNLGFNVDAVTFSRSMGLGGSSDGSWLPESKELARNRGIFFQYGQSRACPDNTSSLIKFR
ncbi:MAG: hypothetical protein FJ161_03700 [Gammaproteobacteria bacterium]|nr:hypothetical protein [Gammaproteobacteria bacterium]